MTFDYTSYTTKTIAKARFVVYTFEDGIFRQLLYAHPVFYRS